MDVERSSGSFFEPLISEVPLLNETHLELPKRFIEFIDSQAKLDIYSLSDMLLIHKITGRRISEKGTLLIIGLIEKLCVQNELSIRFEKLLEKLILYTCSIQDGVIQVEGLDQVDTENLYCTTREILLGDHDVSLNAGDIINLARSICLSLNQSRNIAAVRELFILANSPLVKADAHKHLPNFIEQVWNHLRFVSRIMDDKALLWELRIFDDYRV